MYFKRRCSQNRYLKKRVISKNDQKNLFDQET